MWPKAILFLLSGQKKGSILLEWLLWGFYNLEAGWKEEVPMFVTRISLELYPSTNFSLPRLHIPSFPRVKPGPKAARKPHPFHDDALASATSEQGGRHAFTLTLAHPRAVITETSMIPNRGSSQYVDESESQECCGGRGTVR